MLSKHSYGGVFQKFDINSPYFPGLARLSYKEISLLMHFTRKARSQLTAPNSKSNFKIHKQNTEAAVWWSILDSVEKYLYPKT